MTDARRTRPAGPGGTGPDRGVVALGYLLTSLACAAAALLPLWPAVRDAPVLAMAAAGVVSAAGLLALRSWPVPGPRTGVVLCALSSSAGVCWADGSPAVGVFVTLYAASAAHVPYLRSTREVVVGTALPFALLPAALVVSGHPDQVVGWSAVLPVTTVVPVVVVRSLLHLDAWRSRRDHDSHLLNRAGLLEDCARQLLESDGPDGWRTVNVVHFDDLRDLRLALGPPAAEEVIAECARRAAGLPGAVVARLDLDTLAVVRFVEADGREDLRTTGAREGRVLRERLCAHVVLGADGPGRGLRLRPAVSVGVAFAPEHGRDVQDLLALADVAAVRAADEQHRVAVAEGEATVDVHALRLHAQLPAAVAAGELRLHYQRLVSAATGRTVGVEALVRWQHPEHGLLGPCAFIPLAERSDAVVGLTHWVLETAVAQCAAWRAAGHDVGVSVNVSPVVLADPSLVNAVRRTVARHGLDRGVLTLEVTESALLADPEGAAVVLAVLREAGARVSLDDFGTGYTSLTMLRQLQADELKVDRSFVAAAPHAPVDAAIVRALADLAHRLSMDVVAEGVEDACTAELVRELGADVLQGYHYARPVPAEEVFPAGEEPGRAPAGQLVR